MHASTEVTRTVRATPADAGCWIEGHWGQYSVARMVEMAVGHGYEDAEVTELASRHIRTMGGSSSPDLTTAEHEALGFAADEIETWLNENVAPEGHYFEWADGEFFLSPLVDDDYRHDFIDGYVECALWADARGEDGESVEGLTADDVDHLAVWQSDCDAFLLDNWDDLRSADAGRAGHDFWLTRNRHGAGYWDGDYPEPAASRLTSAAHVYGSVDLYVSEVGKVYGS